MTPTVAEFESLRAGLRSGSQEAWRSFVNQVVPSMRRKAQARLPRRLRSAYTAADFVQEVWVSVLEQPPPETAFASYQTLVAYLETMVRRCVGKTQRKSERQRCDVRRNTNGNDVALLAQLTPRTGPSPVHAMDIEEVLAFLHTRLRFRDRV